MMNDNQLKALLALAAVVWGAYLVKSGVHLDQKMFEPLPSVAGVVLIIAGVFDRYLWHWRIWRPWLVQRPDVRGTWRSNLAPLADSNSDGAASAAREVFFVIRQTFSTLSVRLLTDESTSRSLSADVCRSDDGLYRLLVVYSNEPKLAVRERSPMHLGAMSLDVHGDEVSSLTGHYWTDRRSKGEVRCLERTRATFTDFDSARAAFAQSASQAQRQSH